MTLLQNTCVSLKERANCLHGSFAKESYVQTISFARDHGSFLPEIMALLQKDGPRLRKEPCKQQ